MEPTACAASRMTAIGGKPLRFMTRQNSFMIVARIWAWASSWRRSISIMFDKVRSSARVIGADRHIKVDKNNQD
jgi:hypothetical protein